MIDNKIKNDGFKELVSNLKDDFILWVEGNRITYDGFNFLIDKLGKKVLKNFQINLSSKFILLI